MSKLTKTAARAALAGADRLTFARVSSDAASLTALYEHDDPRSWCFPTGYYGIPRRYVRPMLDVLNVGEVTLLADGVGTIDASGKVPEVYYSTKAPRVDGLVDDVIRKSIGAPALEPMQECGRPIYVKTREDAYARLYRSADGDVVALDAGYLDVFVGALEVHTPGGYQSQWTSEVRLHPSDGPLKPVTIWADYQPRHGGQIGPDGKYVPVAWGEERSALLGIIMPVRL